MTTAVVWKRLRALASALKGTVVQSCPPELYACETCGQLECDGSRWLSCERRLSTAARMDAYLKSDSGQLISDSAHVLDDAESIRLAQDATDLGDHLRERKGLAEHPRGAGGQRR